MLSQSVLRTSLLERCNTKFSCPSIYRRGAPRTPNYTKTTQNRLYKLCPIEKNDVLCLKAFGTTREDEIRRVLPAILLHTLIENWHPLSQSLIQSSYTTLWGRHTPLDRCRNRQHSQGKLGSVNVPRVDSGLCCFPPCLAPTFHAWRTLLKFSILETSLGKRPSSACGLTQAQTEAPAIFPDDIFLISGLLLKAFT